MARGRLISRSLGSSRRYHDLLRVGGRLGEFCQVLFPLIVANTDDWGRMAGDAFTVKNVVLPTSRRPETDFERALEVIAEVELINRYTVDGRIYLQVKQFDEHQTGLHKRTVSRIPEVPESSGKVPTNIREQNRTELKGREENTDTPRLERRGRVSDEFFDRFWAAYPKKKAKADALKAWNARRPDASLLAVMLAALERQCASPDWRKERGRYIPFPASWLRQARWTDEDTTPLDATPFTGNPYGEWTCPHSPRCGHPSRCRTLQALEAGRVAS